MRGGFLNMQDNHRIRRKGDERMLDYCDLTDIVCSKKACDCRICIIPLEFEARKQTALLDMIWKAVKK